MTYNEKTMKKEEFGVVSAGEPVNVKSVEILGYCES